MTVEVAVKRRKFERRRETPVELWPEILLLVKLGIHTNVIGILAIVTEGTVQFYQWFGVHCACARILV